MNPTDPLTGSGAPGTWEALFQGPEFLIVPEGPPEQWPRWEDLNLRSPQTMVSLSVEFYLFLKDFNPGGFPRYRPYNYALICNTVRDYILSHKATFFLGGDIQTCHVRGDKLGFLFGTSSFSRNQITRLIRSQLLPLGATPDLIKWQRTFDMAGWMGPDYNLGYHPYMGFQPVVRPIAYRPAQTQYQGAFQPPANYAYLGRQPMTPAGGYSGLPTTVRPSPRVEPRVVPSYPAMEQKQAPTYPTLTAQKPSLLVGLRAPQSADQTKSSSSANPQMAEVRLLTPAETEAAQNILKSALASGSVQRFRRDQSGKLIWSPINPEPSGSGLPTAQGGGVGSDQTGSRHVYLEKHEQSQEGPTVRPFSPTPERNPDLESLTSTAADPKDVGSTLGSVSSEPSAAFRVEYVFGDSEEENINPGGPELARSEASQERSIKIEQPEEDDIIPRPESCSPAEPEQQSLKATNLSDPQPREPEVSAPEADSSLPDPEVSSGRVSSKRMRSSKAAKTEEPESKKGKF